MKKIHYTFLLVIISITTTQAQLGGLLKKAKDKVTEKTTTNEASNGENKTTEVATKKNNNKQSEEGRFVIADGSRGGEYSGIALNAYQIKERYGKLASLSHIKKENEKGTFHFAKDYTELKGLINDEHLANATIQFSSTPFKDGKGDGKSSFSSNGEHIYAILQATRGTIKDAFKFSSNEDVRLTIQYYLYNDEADKITGNFQTSTYNFVVTPKMAKETNLLIDVMPEKKSVTMYRYGKDDFNSTFNNFANMHTQEKFTKSGNYKVRLQIEAAATDEWGKEKSGETIETNGFFDYDFTIKDAKARVEEASELYAYVKENIKNAPVAVPAEWKATSSPLTMGIAQPKLIDMFRNYFDGKLIDFILVKLHASNSSGGWSIQKNEYGLPQYRYSNQWYTIFMKSKNGKACFYQGFGLRQNYEGGGKYSASFIDANDYHYVNCDEMK